MNRKTRIGLIDGLPFRTFNNVRVIASPEIKYPWDSELFGVPDYRAHANEMIGIIHNENPDSEILIFPFYPKFSSARANYSLIAQNLENAIKHQCQIISICLEMLGVKYLSPDLLKAYKKAYEKGVFVCVSAGNHRPLHNPLIHKKYTIPVIGMTKKTQPIKQSNYKKNQMYFGVGVRSINDNNMHSSDKKMSCSRATAIFAGFLSKHLKKKKLTGNSIELKILLKKHTHETSHFFNLFYN